MNEAAITSLVSLVAAIIGLITAVVTAFTVRPRPAETTVGGAAATTAPPRGTASPQTSAPPQAREPPPHAAPPGRGAYAPPWSPYQAGGPGSGYGPAAPARRPAALKISRSLWLGVVGLLLLAAVWAAPLLCYCCVVPGIWIAVHDLRSPGTRRLAAAGLAICAVGFAGALTDSVIYFATLKTHI